MMAECTNDPDVIRQWAAIRGAVPVERLPQHVDGEEPTIGLIFPYTLKDDSGRTRVISWEHFFDRLERLELSFLGGDARDLRPNDYRLLHDPADLVDYPTVA